MRRALEASSVHADAQERTKVGLAAARALGRMGGRPRKLGAKEVATARRLLEKPEQAVRSVQQLLGVRRSALDRALDRPTWAKANQHPLTSNAC